MKVKVKKLHPDAKIPEYATDGAGCFDIRALTDSPKTIYLGESHAFRTGLAFEIPDSHVMLIYSRSGQAFKHGTRLANCVAVIDADYRGEVKVKLTRDYETDTEALTVCDGDRIAQGMVIPVERVTFEQVEELGATERGAGGFGSTGKA